MADHMTRIQKPSRVLNDKKLSLTRPSNLELIRKVTKHRRRASTGTGLFLGMKLCEPMEVNAQSTSSEDCYEESTARDARFDSTRLEREVVWEASTMEIVQQQASDVHR